MTVVENTRGASDSYPMYLDPYVYAGVDLINYFDPDGRFASYAYETVKPVAIEAFQSLGFKAARYGCNAAACPCGEDA